MTGSHWRDAFEDRKGGRIPAGAPPTIDAPSPEPDDGLPLDLATYQPWLLQRGRSRPALMLDLRRYEPRSGMWTGWAVSYPHLVAIEYTGHQLLSLDFGTRQFVLEGSGLDELARHLQLGSVLAIHEFAPTVWPSMARPSLVSAIRKI